jgi:5-bromo-4-chloroindolyl phosphate hydrolysis protein
MKEKFKKLIDVKSIVTIFFSGVFCFLSVTGKISAEQFLTVFTVVISFYFGTQTEKKKQAITD